MIVSDPLHRSTAQRWARLREDVRRCQLRRGAWYPVVSLNTDEAVILIRQQTVIVPLAFLEIVRSRPTLWTAIARERYVVCPACAERVAIANPPERLRCGRCGGTYAVELNHRQSMRAPA